MKKHLSIWLLAILTILSSCNEGMEQPQSELMAITIAVETESGILSRASYSEDDPLTRCLLEVRDADGLLVGEQHTAEVLADGSFTFDLRLNPAAKYDFLFWVDGGEAYYNASDLTDITVANAEGTAGIACSGKLKRELLEPSMQIVLQHVVAKVTFKPTNKLNEESPLEIALPMYTSYNVVDGIVIGDVEERKASFTVNNTAADNGSESAPAYSFYTLAAESDVQNITLSHEGYTVDVTNVPVMTNRHTVLTGRVGKIESRITAELSSTWTGDETISSIVLGKGLLSEDNMDYMLQCNQGTLAFEGDMSQEDIAVISGFCAHDSRVKRIDLSRCRMTEIPDRAFERSLSLEEVILPEGITTIGSYAFNACISLTSILLPASLRVIGDFTFQDCYSLKSVTLPGSLEIGRSIFIHCNSLTSVTLGEGITTAGIEMFWNCRSLTTVTLPESFSIVSDSFFGHCSSLTSITLPANVTTIEGYAFADCTALSSITLKGTTPPTIDKTAFDNASANYSIIVPKGCKQIYIDSSKGWDKYADHITETVE
ncbi:leucine-rich repeat domain-containing protein [Phocaeicola sp.]